MYMAAFASRLINPAGPEVWQREIVLLSPPTVPGVKLDGVESHVGVAMRMRADLNQARLSVQRGELEVVRTRNGLLPRLDRSSRLGRQGTPIRSAGRPGGCRTSITIFRRG